MTTFRHHPEGRIWINDILISLTDFLIEEPAYALPDEAIGREYDGIVERLYDGKREKRVLGPNIILDGYIANLTTYQVNIQSRIDSKTDSDYAIDLATAKSNRKKLSKAEAVQLFRTYQDTDLELNSTQLNAYKSDLIAQKTIIVSEINALTTIKEVREYQYTKWPPIP